MNDFERNSTWFACVMFVILLQIITGAVYGGYTGMLWLFPLVVVGFDYVNHKAYFE